MPSRVFLYKASKPIGNCIQQVILPEYKNALYGNRSAEGVNHAHCTGASELLYFVFRDLLSLERILLDNPRRGDVIEGTGGARKLRIQLNDNRGKSGGERVIYLDIFETERTFLLFAYPKNVQENLTPEQKKAIAAMISRIKGE